MLPKPQEPRVTKSNIFIPPEKRDSFGSPKPGGKMDRFAGGKGAGGLISSSLVRKARDTMRSKLLLLAEKQPTPSKSNTGTTVKNFLQHMLPNKDREQEEPLHTVQAPAPTTQCQGPVSGSRLSMHSGRVESHVLLMSVSRILEEKLRLQNDVSASTENLQTEEPWVNRWSSYQKYAAFPQSKRVISKVACGQQARPEHHSHCMTMRWNTERASNPAVPPQEPGPLTGHLHCRPMEPGASDNPIHCPQALCSSEKCLLQSVTQFFSHLFWGKILAEQTCSLSQAHIVCTNGVFLGRRLWIPNK
ncbi:PREDICTED: spermatogenesis-associated protein 31E1-like [Chinchilla lanigera]|uniref:spermatogenesis-associated protein 31E1-like n=1 Tax=Chinchilla lanigera TaxID=34839 RepID=UPI0006972DB3|nr:PREDICTED: spermatogenesis-associated protein 31E1-like [Chinchilla lanigera]